MTYPTNINQLDLAFVVDTTGSMSGLIAAAQTQMVAMIAELAHAAAVDMHLGVVEYRDHPPQDQLTVRLHPLTSDLEQAQATILGLSAAGGGDGPEAVLDGVLAACRELEWRPHARRIAVLVGDAPPHGVGASGDGFPRGCPCGETIDSATAAAERARVTFCALGLTAAVADSFTQLSRLTGGGFYPASQGAAAIERLRAILTNEFGNLDFDRRVLAAHMGDRQRSIGDLAVLLAEPRLAVAAAIGRLESRDLLDE
jgi:Mg-chelatase subunit ChlD